MKHAQFWQIDFVISLLIMIAALSISVVFFTHETSDTLVSSASRISDILLTSGIPSDWNSTNVRLAGLTSNDWRIVPSKITDLYTFTASQARVHLNANDRFYIQLLDNSVPVNITDRNGIEREGAGYAPSNESEQTAISRIVIYNERPMILRVITWH